MADDDDTIDIQQVFRGFADLSGDLGADGFLRVLTKFANTFGVEIGIRLFFSGGVLSGTLVSGATWFSLVADEIAPEGAVSIDEDSDPELLSHAAVAGMAEAFRNFGRGYQERAEEERARPEGTEVPFRDQVHISHIHLRDAWLYPPTGNGPLLVGPWRGRLASITGWAMGTYGTSD